MYPGRRPTAAATATADRWSSRALLRAPGMILSARPSLLRPPHLFEITVRQRSKMTTKFGDFSPLEPFGPYEDPKSKGGASASARSTLRRAAAETAAVTTTTTTTAPPPPMRLRGKASAATFGPLLPLFAGEPYGRARPKEEGEGEGATAAAAAAADPSPTAAAATPSLPPFRPASTRPHELSPRRKAEAALLSSKTAPEPAAATSAPPPSTAGTAAAAAEAETAAAEVPPPLPLPPRHARGAQPPPLLHARPFASGAPGVHKGSYGTPGTTIGPAFAYIADPERQARRWAGVQGAAEGDEAASAAASAGRRAFVVPCAGRGSVGGGEENGSGGVSLRRNEGLGGRVGGACGEFEWRACPPAAPGGAVPAAAAASAKAAAVPFRPAPSRAKKGATFSPFLSLCAAAVLSAGDAPSSKERRQQAVAAAGEAPDGAGAAGASLSPPLEEAKTKEGSAAAGAASTTAERAKWRGGACPGRSRATRSIVALAVGRMSAGGGGSGGG